MRGQFMILMDAIDNASDVADEVLGGWVRVARFCAGKLNGGRIPACKAWTKDDWLRAARVTRKRVDTIVAGSLAHWDVADLVLHNYDTRGDGIYSRQRDGGQATAAKYKKEETTPGDQGGRPGGETTPGDLAGDHPRQGMAGHGGGMAREIPSTDVSEDTPQARPAPRLLFSKGQAATWMDKNRDLFPLMNATFSEDGSRVVDVLRYFQVKWETKKDGPLNGEWTRDTQGRTALEVFNVFARAPMASIKLPSHYRAARDHLETTERTA